MPDARGTVLVCNTVVWTAFFALFTSTSQGFDGAAVLRNFRLEACEGQTIDLICPENTTISVGSLSLQRGETWKDEENIGCPPLPSTPSAVDYDADGVGSSGSTEHRHGHQLNDVENDVGRCPMNSMQSRMLKTMARLCDHHRFCEAPVSAEILLGRYEGRPCRGQLKRMEVFYKCRPSAFQTKIVCEDEPFELQCNGRSRVMIFSTTFGRNPVGSDQCPQKEGGPEESCDSDSPSMDIMTKLCDGRNKCGLVADPVVFADPCQERSSPFLTIVYACVPEHILLNAEPMGAEGIREDEYGNIISPTTTTEDPPTTMSITATPLPLPTLVLNLENSAQPNETRRHLYFPTDIHAANYTKKPDDVRQQGDMRRHIPHWNESIFPELCGVNDTKGNHVMGVITEWLRAYQFISANMEKFVLYLLLSVCIGLLLFCFVLICHLWASNRRRAKRIRRIEDGEGELLRDGHADGASTSLRNGSSTSHSPAHRLNTSSGGTSSTITVTPPPPDLKPKVKMVASVGTVTNFPPRSLLMDAIDDAEADLLLQSLQIPKRGLLVATTATPTTTTSTLGLGRPVTFATDVVYNTMPSRHHYGGFSPNSRPGMLAPLVEIDGNSDEFLAEAPREPNQMSPLRHSLGRYQTHAV